MVYHTHGDFLMTKTEEGLQSIDLLVVGRENPFQDFDLFIIIHQIF